MDIQPVGGGGLSITGGLVGGTYISCGGVVGWGAIAWVVVVMMTASWVVVVTACWVVVTAWVVTTDSVACVVVVAGTTGCDSGSGFGCGLGCGCGAGAGGGLGWGSGSG